MSFNEHYIDDVLKRRYRFAVERDATGMAFNAFCGPDDAIVHLSGPWGDKEAARQTGIANLIEKIEKGEVKSA